MNNSKLLQLEIIKSIFSDLDFLIKSQQGVVQGFQTAFRNLNNPTENKPKSTPKPTPPTNNEKPKSSVSATGNIDPSKITYQQTGLTSTINTSTEAQTTKYHNPNEIPLFGPNDFPAPNNVAQVPLLNLPITQQGQQQQGQQQGQQQAPGLTGTQNFNTTGTGVNFVYHTLSMFSKEEISKIKHLKERIEFYKYN